MINALAIKDVISISILIGDACCNHLNNIQLIEQMIVQAKEIGVDIIKFQSFNPNKLNHEWLHMYEYYKKLALDEEMHEFIINKCKEVEIDVLFTAFSIDRAHLLKRLGQKKIKIGSAEADKEKLVNYCISNFEEVIISCGMIDDKRIRELRKYGNVKLLYCVSRYPTRLQDIDFSLMQLFDGFSDHTTNLFASKKAIENGVPIVERHFTLGKYLPGNDHMCSSTPDELKELVEYRDNLIKIEKYKNRWRD